MGFHPRPSSSLEYVPVVVVAKEAGAYINPTSDTVEMAFTSDGSDPVTWYAAQWETDSTTNPDTYTALCLVGPGGTTTLAEGDYSVFVRVTDSPEIPVLHVPGLLSVT